MTCYCNNYVFNENSNSESKISFSLGTTSYSTINMILDDATKIKLDAYKSGTNAYFLKIHNYRTDGGTNHTVFYRNLT